MSLPGFSLELSAKSSLSPLLLSFGTFIESLLECLIGFWSFFLRPPAIALACLRMVFLETWELTCSLLAICLDDFRDLLDLADYCSI